LCRTVPCTAPFSRAKVKRWGVSKTSVRGARRVAHLEMLPAEDIDVEPHEATSPLSRVAGSRS